MHRVFRQSRSLSTSPLSLSHVGSVPIRLPASVELLLAPSTAASPPQSSTSSAASQFTPISAAVTSNSPDMFSTSSTVLRVTGPKGVLDVELKPFVTLLSTPPGSDTAFRTLSVSVADPTGKQQRSTWGLTRSLIANAVNGVAYGYDLTIRLVGVGYRATVEPIPDLGPHSRPSSPVQRLNLKLAYSHPVFVPIPRDIHASTPNPTTILLVGNDKQRLGELAARIRRWRVPEPYKGKGIFVGSEVVKRKEIKKK